MNKSGNTDLSMVTVYMKYTGDPLPYLRRIADAGFSHVHWCHHWCTDFLYSRCEIDQIGTWLKDLGLRLLDLHGSDGPEKNWGSSKEYERRAGVELVRNRLEMTARLGGDAVVMHLPSKPDWDVMRRTLDELQPIATSLGVKIAVENGVFDNIARVLSEYGPDFVGLCYDSGHGNMIPDGLQQLEQMKQRLIAIHLHDNDGQSDQHKPLFSGTVKWEQLARIITTSAYKKCISMEVAMRNTTITDEVYFLNAAYDEGMRFAQMVAAG